LVDFIDFLENRLAEPLPGQNSQALMMPSIAGKSRFSLKAKKDARPGGVMLMLYKKNGQWFFPLIQRPDYDGVHAKQMSFPGGKYDDTDKDLTETALRETEEEIGVGRDHLSVIGHLSELFIIASNFNVLPTVAYYNGSPSFIPDEYEVDTIEEIEVQELIAVSNQKEKPMTVVNGVTINAPYFHLNDKVVWGATAMMLSEFKEIVKPFYQNMAKL
jgi:8-oxo-dGTP pyrophosphatase MutT (NUDIX family)